MARKPYQWPADGKPAVIQQHSVAKHDVLRAYLIDYIQTLVVSPQQDQLRLTVVDGFAGGGIYVGLAVFAVIMSLIGAFYYLRVIKVMYFDAPTQTAQIDAPLDVRAVLSVNGALVLVLGIVPGGLMALCADAVRALLA